MTAREPVPGATGLADPFGRRAALVLGVALPVLVTVTVVYALVGSSGGVGAEHGSNTYSVSAVGFRGLVDMLDDLGVPVLASRRASGQRVDTRSALVVLAPGVDETGTRAAGRMLDQAEERGASSILVLPKWSAQPAPRRPEWSARVDPIPPNLVGSVLGGLLDIDHTTGLIVRPPRPTARWTSRLETDTAPTLYRPQLIAAGIEVLEPLVWCTEGVLVAAHRDRPLTVVADPDLLNNAGLGVGDNAIMVHSVLLRNAAVRALVFDETIHGFSAAPSIWRQMFTFPLVLVSLHLGILFTVVLWAGAIRFGAPRARPPRYTAGAITLIDATARMVRLAGTPVETVRRYWDLMLRRTAAEIGLGPYTSRSGGRPPDLNTLAAVGRQRRVGVDVRRLAATVDGLGDHDTDRRRLLAVVRSIHSWREEMLDGPHSHR